MTSFAQNGLLLDVQHVTMRLYLISMQRKLRTGTRQILALTVEQKAVENF